MVTRDSVIEALKKVKDPEIGIDIWSLGLVYEVKVIKNKVDIRMTLTTPMCPFGPQLIGDVKFEVGEVKGVSEVNVDLVFEPLWQPPEDLKMSMGLL